jgi:hypothetical protein
MRRLLRAAHLGGLLLLGGGLLAAGLATGAADTAEPRALAVLAHTAYGALLKLALPGLMLLIATGVAQMFMLRLTPDRSRWIAVKLSLVAVLAGDLILFRMPAGRELVVVSARVAEGLSVRTPPEDLLGRLAVSGWLDLSLILAVVALSAIRPAFRLAPRQGVE